MHACKVRSCRFETTCALCTSHCPWLGIGRSARLLQSHLWGCNCKKRVIPTSKTTRDFPIGNLLSEQERNPSCTLAPCTANTEGCRWREPTKLIYSLLGEGMPGPGRCSGHHPGLPNPLQKDAAQLKPTVMEGPHPQETPGGVWPSDPAPWEMHAVHTMLLGCSQHSAGD